MQWRAAEIFFFHLLRTRLLRPLWLHFRPNSGLRVPTVEPIRGASRIPQTDTTGDYAAIYAFGLEMDAGGATVVFV